MICECYRAEKNFLGKVGLCWGTAERDACSCGGDKSKCDFYPSVREEEKKPPTNYDLLIRKTPEEMAEFLWSIGASPFNGAVYINGKPIFSTAQGNKWLDWLKSPAEEGDG